MIYVYEKGPGKTPGYNSVNMEAANASFFGNTPAKWPSTEG